MLLKVVLILTVWGGFFWAAPGVQAAVIITEVHPNPLSGPEWVELYNSGDSSVDLNNWLLEDQLSSPSVIATLNTPLSPQTYLKVDLATQKLNNTADGVTLKDVNASVVDTMSYPSTTAGLSWSRSLASASYTQTDPTPGQGQSNPTPSPSPTPEAFPSPSPSPLPNPTAYLYLQASEIQACPETGDQEWLEVYNPTDYQLNLEAWHVKDNAENLRSVSATIPAHSFGVFSWASGLLNNTGDSISLISPDEENIFTANFNECQKNTSYILDQETWKLTTSVTKNQVNRLTAPTPSPSPSSAPPKTSPIPKAVNSKDSSTTAEKEVSVLGVTPSQPLTTATSLQKTLTTSPFATTSLQLAAPIYHPFASGSAETINLAQPLPNAPAIVSVIMGGTVLLATHGLKLYRLYQDVLAQTPVTHQSPRLLFP